MKTDTEHLQKSGKAQGGFSVHHRRRSQTETRVSFWRESFSHVSRIIHPQSFSTIGRFRFQKFRPFQTSTESKRCMEKFEAEISNLNLTVIYNWHMRCVS